MTFAILELHCSLYILQVNTCNPTVIDFLWLFALAKTVSSVCTLRPITIRIAVFAF